VGKAEALALANAERIAFAQSCREGAWRRVVPGEGWPVGVRIHHGAAGHPLLTGRIRELLCAGRVEGSPAELGAANAGHAERFAGVSVDEAVAACRRTGAAAAAHRRTLPDADLDRERPTGIAGGRTLTSRPGR